MRRTKVPSHFGPLFLSTLLTASVVSTPVLHAQAPAAGTAVSVRMIDTVNSASDPAGKQYRASVTTAVTAANDVSIPQGAAATVTLTSNGSGYTARLSSITLNGQAVAVTSNSASVSSVGQYAQSRAANAVGSILGHHVSAPASVAAAATGQRVSLPTGTTLTFVLGESPASNSGGSIAPAAQGGQPAPAQQTAYAAPAPAAAPAPGHDAYLCRYYGQKDAHPITYVTPIIYTGAPPNQAFFNYLNTTFDLSKIQYGTGSCRRYSNDPATQANSVDMLEKQWAASKTEVIHVDWTNSPSENATATAKLASAATAAAVPTAAANQHYVFCNSARVEVAGAVEYFSDIFPAVTLPQAPAGGGKGGNGGEYVTAVSAFQRPFFAFLQKQYGYKDSGNYPTECAITYPPTAGGLQQAQAAKRQLQDLARQNKGQVVETGWKNQ